MDYLATLSILNLLYFVNWTCLILVVEISLFYLFIFKILFIYLKDR